MLLTRAWAVGSEPPEVRVTESTDSSRLSISVSCFLIACSQPAAGPVLLPAA